jgi:hypothetical protein
VDPMGEKCERDGIPFFVFFEFEFWQMVLMIRMRCNWNIPVPSTYKRIPRLGA